MQVYDWIDANSKHYLTIEEVLKFGNKPFKVLVMDRNMCDSFYNNYGFDNDTKDLKKFSIPRDCVDLFKYNFATITLKDGLNSKGTAVFHWKSKDYERDFEFDISLKDFYYPLTNGKLPEYDVDGFFDLGENAGKSWKDFPKKTNLGWRGPMILYSKLHGLPKVYLADTKK